LTELLARLRTASILSALDVELALALGRLAPAAEEVLLAAALASRATRDGHVCARLRQLSAEPLRDDGARIVADCPPLGAWRQKLLESTLVGDGTGVSPLVLDAEDRVYLRRHWDDEQRLSRLLRKRARTPSAPAAPPALANLVRRLFGPHDPGAPDWQRIAAQISAVSTLAVVSGGPGTGKTSTAVRLVAVALADAFARGVRRPRALLLAPTGKAAARLAEAVGSAKATLDCPGEVLARVPTGASTIHRALEVDRLGRFRIDQERPLLADIVVVDEASMVDVSLMRRLVEAVPSEARLVLLGDRHQLSSVDAGAVLSDICGDRGRPSYSADLAARVGAVFEEPLPQGTVTSAAAGIDDSVVTLEKSHRFSSTSPLGSLASAVQRGDANAVVDLLRSKGGVVELVVPRAAGLDARLVARAAEKFGPFSSSATPDVALDRLTTFRVLCAHRTGPLGVEEANRAIERALRVASPGPHGVLFPILIHENDVDLELFNGDVGVLFRDETSLRAVFKNAAGGLRAYSTSRLPAHEPAFAMSVHKSQGSEFDDVVVVLPAPGSPLLTRELLYTAITRARRSVIVQGTEAAVREAVAKPAIRASGLAAALRA
jgi:exodeoxyribonuclease V alpha subunit